jgi:hypothetical protein
MRALHVPLLVITSALCLSCGPKRVQLYEGQLSDEEITVVFTNPHLELAVDRQYKLTGDDRTKLQKLELPVGHHTVEVSCVYSDDVTYNPPPDKAPATTAEEAKPAPAEKITQSPVIVLVADGEAGHSYKPRVHFYRNAQGVPGCRVRMFDVTSESGGHSNHFY